LPKDQLPEPVTAIVADNPKRVIYWNDRYNAIAEINIEIGSVLLCDSCVYLSTKNQRIANLQSIRVRDHYQKEIV
jgi:predicted phosphatase